MTVLEYSIDRSPIAYGPRGVTVRGSAIDASMSVLAADPRPIISFAMGSPGTDAIPSGDIAAATRRVLTSRAGRSALDYAPTEGDPTLRSALMERFVTLGEEVDPRCLLVTAGGMQGLDLVYRLFLQPGDLVLAESPSYANGLAAAHNHGAQLVQVPLDADGLDLDAAADAVRTIGRPPRIVYAIPSFQNPTGLTYTRRRREELLELARSWGALVIEDDPYSELRYEGDAVPSLLALDRGAGRVIQVRTFSKIIAPGLRLGWVIGPVDVVGRMVDLRQSMDTCANGLAQRTVADLLTRGEVDRHVNRLRHLYPARRDRMVDALECELGQVDGIRWTRPKGGMFLWLDLPDHILGDDVLTAGLARGVAVVPGGAFDDIRCRHAIRLCFSAVDDAAIDAGIPLLSQVIIDLERQP